MENNIAIAQIILEKSLKIQAPLYYIILVDKAMQFSIDFVKYDVANKACIFMTPYQLFQLESAQGNSIKTLAFHGDFYCIEYHKKEVACNGILFNNIYTTPYIFLEPTQYAEIENLFYKIESIQQLTASYEISLMKATLQLILAICSKEKQLNNIYNIQQKVDEFASFRALIEAHFLKERNINFYAQHYHISNESLSKKIKNIYGKPPSVLIKERLLLEAKKQLHLTYKNINEIAFYLGFEDEFYFSKFFKKEIGVSPKAYREKVGISIVAK